MAEYQHQTVLSAVAVEYLNIKPNGIYVDATVGGAGHAQAIAARLNSSGILVAIDQDQNAIAAAQERLENVKPKVILIKRNFRDLAAILPELRLELIDGVLFDLGVSTPQLDHEERGFSYQSEAPLDMRMDQTQPFSAAHLVNTASVAELTRILWQYGEERWAKRIAAAIERRRREQPLTTTTELAELIKQAIPAAARRSGPHPARRSFQALRIAVNQELEALESGLKGAFESLKPDGRIVVISFHSLEDRLVKQSFTQWAQGCCCPRELPVCQCQQQPRLRILTKKPILPSTTEIESNRRARSAKLRAAVKLL